MQETLIDALVDEYRLAVRAHAADRMVVISREIGSRGPEATATFAQLLGSEEELLSASAAHHLLDFMQPDEEARRRALSLIEKRAQGQTAEARSEQVWLENLSAEQQDE